MKSALLQVCLLCATLFCSASEEVDPFGEAPVKEGRSESEPREVTEAGRKTLNILRTEKIDSVRLVTGKFEEGYGIVRDRLGKHGIEVRIKRGRKLAPDDPLKVKPIAVPEEGDFLKLEDVTLERFMKVFDQWALSGWILYPDGSITYFEHQCCGAWPKDGIYCHDSQYEAGKPEVMKAASERQQAEQAEQAGSGQPATRSQLKSEGADKPQPESEGRSR